MGGRLWSDMEQGITGKSRRNIMGICMNAFIIIIIIKIVSACCYLCVKATSSFPRCSGRTYLAGWRRSRAVTGRRQQQQEQQTATTTRENFRPQDPRGEEHGDHKTTVKKKRRRRKKERKKEKRRETNFFFSNKHFLV